MKKAARMNRAKEGEKEEGKEERRSEAVGGLLRGGRGADVRVRACV